MRSTILSSIGLALLSFSIGCKEENKVKSEIVETSEKVEKTKIAVIDTVIIKEKPEDVETPKGMVWIPGGVIVQGAVPQDKAAMGHEKPAHKVAVDGFFHFRHVAELILGSDNRQSDNLQQRYG